MNKEERIKQLFSAVRDRDGLPLSIIFNQFAVKWGMQKDSVRNIYYNALNKVLSDEEYAHKIGVELRGLNKNKIKPFNDLELREMLHSIEQKLSEGKSVRRACYELADGDVELMLRYQNKYRALKGGNVDLNKVIDFGAERQKMLSRQEQHKQGEQFSGFESCMLVRRRDINSISKEKEEEKGAESLPSNVIKFKRKGQALTDGELQSLFMGLVRIVRNSAVVDVDNALREQCNKRAIEVRNLLKNLAKARDELNESLRENAKLKKELELVKMDKVNDYEKFLRSLKAKAETEETDNSKEIDKKEV